MEQVQLETSNRSEVEQVAKETGFTKELVDMLIKKVYLFPDNYIEVKWKIKGFLKELFFVLRLTFEW